MCLGICVCVCVVLPLLIVYAVAGFQQAGQCMTVHTFSRSSCVCQKAVSRTGRERREAVQRYGGAAGAETVL